MQSLTEILNRIEKRSLSPEAAIRESLDAIAAKDAALRAFVRVASDAQPGPPGPLRGIAVGIKDTFDTADFPSEYGSSIYAGWRPRADASVVALLRRAGATIVGKTTTTPFAYSDPSQARNPHHPGHSPGGSSSGSAAAVGAGLVPLAFGSQTVGSVIRPASFCGAAAMKPSYQLLCMVGVKPLAPSLDTMGFFAATVGDLALVLAVLTDRPELQKLDSAPPRIGVVRQDFAGPPEESGNRALARAVEAAEQAGATVRKIALPEIVAEAWRVLPILQEYEAVRAMAWEYDNHRDSLKPNLRAALDRAAKMTATEYDRCQAVALEARTAIAAAFDDVDVLLTFSAPGIAPVGFDTTGDPKFNRVWTLLGTPCVNVPGLRESGLPVGVQMVGRFGHDRQVLSAARFLEGALART